MQKIFIVFLQQNDPEEEELVAIFDSQDLAESFMNRHPRFYGRYRMAENELNPPFEKTDQYTYQVIIYPKDANKKDLIAATQDFQSERLIQNRPIIKLNDSFIMDLFADDKRQAYELAKAKYKELIDSGEWLLMKDVNDED